MDNNFQQVANPLDPEMGANADQMLSFFLNRSASQRNEVPEAIPVSFNPFQPDQQSQEQSQDKHIGQMEQFLSPIKMDAFDSAKSYTEDKHQNFLDNLENCPAQKEYGPQLDAFLQSILQAINSGQISPDDANKLIKDFAMSQVKPVIDKHLSKTERKQPLHGKREPEIPDIIKKVKGVK